MSEIFLKLIEQLNSSVFVLVAILILAFWSLYKLGGIIKTFSHFKENNEKIDNSVGGIKDTLASIKATTDLLYQAHLSTIKSHSPLSLTEKGAEISTALKIEEKINKHWSEIKTKIETKSPSNPYDIQTLTMDLAKDCFSAIFSEEERNEIKLYAYKIGMNLLEIVPIIGIVIRDRYLKEKNIDIKEIDKHAPTR